MPLKVAILGFGTVGASAARILSERNLPGLALTHVYNRNVARKRVDWLPSVTWTEDLDAVLASDADIIVELIGGLNPAHDSVRRALEAGKSVVTANKKLIALHGPELESMARKSGSHLLYGAAVAGGIPVIPGLQHGLAGDKITRIEGILNGTSNFILSRMEHGAEYADELAEAQRRGYAEADPTEDVDGFDARSKLVILARLALGANVSPEEIACQSIRQVGAIDFAYARDLGCTIRPVARADVRNGNLVALVGPMLVPFNSPLAWSRGTENMVLMSGQYGGDVVFSGHGAGGNPTAVAVVSDLCALAAGTAPGVVRSAPAAVTGEFELRHYVRFVVNDRPGIVAEIAGAMAAQGINIDSLFQRSGFGKDKLPFVVTTEPCVNSRLKLALARMQNADWQAEPPLDLQVLEPEPAVVS
ncbi:MAG: homoserine dehydrogenase [Acidobacteriaceae bacterium]